MSIPILLEDAEVLWKANRKLGSFTLVLITVSATARKRYPKETTSWKDPKKTMGDAEAFHRFILDEMDKVTGGPKYNVAFPFMGKKSVPLEAILYTHLRCQLVHEASIPSYIYLTPPVITDGRRSNILKLRDPLGFPEGWIENLARVVRFAPENEGEFKPIST